MTQAVILAGGKGTRISEETRNIPKPMIRLANKPVLHHLMDIYISQGVLEFVIMTGYKSEVIYGYFLGIADSFSKSGVCTTFQTKEWTAILVESGMETQTGGRLKRAESLVKDDFFFTYGDGLSDVDLSKVMKKHKEAGAIATISGVRPVPRFGSILFEGDGKVWDFGEKQENMQGWINGGFAAMSPEIFSRIHSDDCNLEKDIYPQLSSEQKLYVQTHSGFWQCLDTLRDLESLEEVYRSRGAVWIK